MSPLEYFLSGLVDADPLSATIIGIALILLVLCSSFFSASEMAFSTVNVARLRTYVEEKRKGAKQALWIAEHFDRTLTSILVGNNLVNIAATSLAGNYF